VKQGQTVLLVDDRETVSGMFQEAAARLKLRFFLAEDGQEGLDLAKSEQPDLIVIRRNVPVLDALSMSVLLRQSEKTKDIPIMVICSDTSVSEQERFQDAGCNGCLQEPLDTEKIFARLRDWPS